MEGQGGEKRESQADSVLIMEPHVWLNPMTLRLCPDLRQNQKLAA